jgi:alpha-D-xyloside xylohydrolase
LRLLLAALFLMPAGAQAQELGAFASERPDGRAVLITSSNGAQIRVTPYGDFLLRIQVARPGEAFPGERTPDMVERHDWPGAIVAEDLGDRIEISAQAPGAAMLLLYKADLTFDFGLFGESEPRLSGGRVSFDGARTSQDFVHLPAEHFAGLGHGYFGRVPKLDLAGTTQLRTYGRQHGDQSPLIVPFYLSSRGYGLFVESSHDVTFSFGAGARYAFTLEAGLLDFFFIAGPRLYDVIDRYTELTGRPRLPPRAMFGLALSDKGHPTTSEAAWWQARVQQHRSLGLPIDHLVNDNRWRAGGGERCVSRFDWDPIRYPDPAAFGRWLRDEGLVITLDFNRCIASQSEGWRPELNLPGTEAVEFGDSSPDLTSEEVRRWWWDLIFAKAVDPALDYPHDALWIDEFDELGLVPAGTITAGGRSWAEVRNLWFLSVAQALGEEGWSRDVGEMQRPFIWVRGMTAGGQRHATLWSGDLASTYEEMSLQVRGMQAAGLSGFPFWGHDAGGFNAEGLDEAAFDLLYRQWSLAFGSFTPYWRPHGVGPLRWPMDRSVASRIVAERYAALRMSLMPYLYTYAREASARGAPMARPLFLEYGNDDRAWTHDLQYLWGRELLIAPVDAAGGGARSVWLPEWPGGGWYDFWTDDLYAAGGVVDVVAPTGRIPIFVRAGSVIPMSPPAESTTFLNESVLDLHVYAGSDGNFTLYEDDGVTELHRGGAFRTQRFEWSQTERTLVIHPWSGTYAGAPAMRRYRVLFHGVAAPPCAELGSAPLPAFHSMHEAESHGAGAFPMSSSRSSGIGVVTEQSDGELVLRLAGSCSADPVRRFQAEGARTNGTPGQKPSASGGAYVGGLEMPGAFVELDVEADRAGEHSVAVGFANGGTEWASRALYVNGTHVRDLVFPPTADWWLFGKTAYFSVALAAGPNTIRIQTDDGDRAVADIDYLDVIDGPPSPAAPFQLEDGLLVIEAEHFHRTHDMGGHAFLPITRPHGHAGGGALIALPDLEVNRDTDLADAPRADYQIEIPAGTYHLWVRGHAYGDGDDDSLHAGLDGEPLPSADRITFTDAAGWTWTRATMDGDDATLEVTQGGLHTLSLWMREDGSIVDRILLAADPSFVPTLEGPPESPRVGETMEPGDAGLPDAPPGDDAGGTAPSDGGTDGGAAEQPEDEGCACTGHGRRDVSAPWSLVLLAVGHVLAGSLQARARLRRRRPR